MNEKNISEKDKDNEQAVVCNRCDMRPAYVPGCIKDKCSFCGTEVWVSPASQKKKFDKIYCIDCWNIDFGSDRMCYMKESIAEFNEWHKKRYGFEMKEEDIIKKVEEEMGKDMGTKIKMVLSDAKDK